MNISNKDIKVLIQWNMNCVKALRRLVHEADAQAYTETSAMLDALHAENARLREALAFYVRIRAQPVELVKDFGNTAEAALEWKP
jgi:hypothetical protein